MTDDAGSPTPEAAPPPVTHHLRRSTDDKMIAGVCGGLASYLGIDTALVRVIAVVLALTGGAAVLAYIVAWVLIPEARPGELQAAPQHNYNTERLRFLAGAVLIGIGGLALLGTVLPGLWASRVVWPLVLIAGGALLLVRGTKRS